MNDIYNQFISAPALALVLGISRVAVFNRIRAKKIFAVKVGRNYLIKKSDLPNLFDSSIKSYGQTNSFRGISQRAALLLYNLVNNFPYHSHRRLICSAQLVIFLFKNGKEIRLSQKAIEKLVVEAGKNQRRRKEVIIENLRRIILKNMVDIIKF